MKNDIQGIIEQFVDLLMPELTPYEAAMHIFLLPSFAESPELSSSGMNAEVAAVMKVVSQGFLLRRVPLLSNNP